MTKNKLKKMKKKELLELAESKRLLVSTRMLKADLIDTIYDYFVSGEIKTTSKTARPKKKTRAKQRSSAKKTSGKKSKKPSNPPVASTADKNNRTIRQKAVAGKYHLTKGSSRDLLKSETLNLPEYDVTRIVCMIRDPHWIFTYWKISLEQYDDLKKMFGPFLSGCKLILRVYDYSYSPRKKKYFNIEIPDDSNNWYIYVSQKNKYRVGIGMISPEGVYKEIAISDIIETPPEGVSEYSDEKWTIPDFTFNQILTASGELKKSLSSEEYLKTESSSAFNSEAVSSFSDADIDTEVELPPSIKMELVVYGTSGDDSRISLLGKEIETNEDGSFSIRMSLPEGELELPIKLTSSDGKWEKIVKTRIETRKS